MKIVLTQQELKDIVAKHFDIGYKFELVVTSVEDDQPQEDEPVINTTPSPVDYTQRFDNVWCELIKLTGQRYFKSADTNTTFEAINWCLKYDEIGLAATIFQQYSGESYCDSSVYMKELRSKNKAK